MGQFWPAVVHGFGLAQLLGRPGLGLQPTYESRGARSMAVGQRRPSIPASRRRGRIGEEAYSELVRWGTHLGGRGRERHQ
jgi:hypothetical protein